MVMKHSPYNQLPSGDGWPANTTIYIAGDNVFNNDVLANFLESQTGLPCHLIPHSQLPQLLAQAIDRPTVVFLDCTAGGEPKTCKCADNANSLKNTRCMVACFNVDPEAGVESAALKRGIKGILYHHQPAELYVRAAKAILNGELWFPRATLESHIMADGVGYVRPADMSTVLTRREREILCLLASGITNQEIAGKLCISPHTVKTHAYNLFKKINVSNRFEASQWLIDNPLE
jgi:LuxR family transcriptional regulator of csgAB operon